MSELNRQVTKGAAWMVLFRLADRVIGFVSTLILARLLVPGDFGVVAMAVSILAALELLSAFSFDIALIQNPQAGRAQFDTAWTFGILFGAINALCMCALAVPAAHFFAEPRVEALMYVFGLCSFIQGFENIGIVAFQKDLQLHKEFNFSISKRLAGFVTTIALAVLTGSYWAMAIGTLVTKLVGVSLSYYVHPYRARLSLAAASELLHFSKWLLLNNFLIFVNNRGTDFIIGRLQGAGSLGLYAMSYELSNLPTTELVWPIQRAVFPGYTKVAADPDKLRRFFVQVIGFLTLLTVPAGTFVGLCAEPLVAILLGPKWAATVPLIQVLAVFGIVRALHGPTGSVFMAIGKPFIVAINQSVQIIVAVVLMLLLIPRLGTIGAAWSILCGATMALLSSYLLLLRHLQLPLARLLAAVWRPMVGGLCMWTAALCASQAWPMAQVPAIVRLVFLGGVGLAAYMGVVLGLWWAMGRPDGGETTLVGFLGDRLRRARTQPAA